MSLTGQVEDQEWLFLIRIADTAASELEKGLVRSHKVNCKLEVKVKSEVRDWREGSLLDQIQECKCEANKHEGHINN